MILTLNIEWIWAELKEFKTFEDSHTRIFAWKYEIDWWSGQCHGGIIALMGFCDWFDKKVSF